MANKHSVGYEAAREAYAALGVETEEVLALMDEVSLSLPCWQLDDVKGFETSAADLDGGIAVTGHYPGRAGSVKELRQDLDRALDLIPGRHRVNLHSIYGEFGGSKTDRDRYDVSHFQGWIDWALQRSLGLDFNATCFSHPKAASGTTLSSPDPEIRRFWISHSERCREISAAIGRLCKSPCVHNLWIPDGSKDDPVQRLARRQTLVESLDAIYSKRYPDSEMKDSIESKLFGIGSEAFVAGSYDFYLGYALTRKILPCLDMGHFHPTESIADKVSALLPFFPEILFHLSRGVRWDSDHVVVLDDPIRQLASEIVRGKALDRVHLALDFFDASIHRVGALVIGARAVQKAFLLAFLEPIERLILLEKKGDGFGRLALIEKIKTLPFGSVWDEYCLRHDNPDDSGVIREVAHYGSEVTSKRK